MLALVFVLPVTLIAGVLVLARRNRSPFNVGKIWARLVLRIAGGKVDVHGTHYLQGNENFIFAANHQSIFDILVVMAYLPKPFRWLAKKELFSIPFLGDTMKGIGTIPIARNEKKSALRSLMQALKYIREGSSVMIFPEGTRSKDGTINEFKPGAFFLALKSQRSVVPVAIVGTDRMMPRGSFGIHPRRMKLIITEPIRVNGKNVTKEELAVQTWNRVVDSVKIYGQLQSSRK